MVYNSRDHGWIPYATNNLWANCPGKDPENEYYVIHTIGWSLRLTNITLSLTSNQNFFLEKHALNLILREAIALQAIKATVIWKPNIHCRIFGVGRSYPRMIKF